MGILKTAVYGLSAVSLAAILCHAQVYNFNSVTAGLGNLDVNCIAQDHAGYIWVGTENGLYRYDGRSFSAFGPADGLSSHVIQSLFAAPDGTLDPAWNHNGAVNAIAGIVNAGGNVLGMMPHPENHVEAAMGCTDGRGLFEGLVAYLGRAA